MALVDLYDNSKIINVARAKHICVYCGQFGGIARDHVIPTCYLREKRKYEGDWLVPACAECNTILGSELIFNVPDRAAWILATMRKRYKKILLSVHWDDEELEEIGYSLRCYIEGRQKAKIEINRKIEYLAKVSSMPISYMYSMRPHIDRDIEDVPEFVEDDVRMARERRKILLKRVAQVKKISKEDEYLETFYNNQKYQFI